jgi:hypothetical protein
MLLPHTWNKGMLESWNVGFNWEFVQLLTFHILVKGILAIKHCAIFAKPIIPVFQLRGEAELSYNWVDI